MFVIYLSYVITLNKDASFNKRCYEMLSHFNLLWINRSLNQHVNHDGNMNWKVILV